ncbi:MAG: DUF1015 family protein [Candidatus Wallbacteria bacterium]|nr:DUF1015 family protein [Candidatus Wallbacteria bacterium]
MAIVKAFRAVRFDPRKVSDPGRVIAPPWDSLDPDARRSTVDRDPSSVVRLLPESGPAATLGQWLESQLLERASEPGLYPYIQEYTQGSRKRVARGFIALGRVEAPGAGSVFRLQEPDPCGSQPAPPHSPDADLDPVLMLYSGAAGNADELLAGAAAGDPFVEATDDAGAVHKIWAVTEPGVVSEVVRMMEPARLVLASGEEAYSGALELARGDGSAADYRMMTFASIDGDGPGVTPVHRVIHVADDFDFNHFFEALGSFFDVYPLYGPDAIQGLLDKATPGEVRIVTFIAKPRRCLLMVPKPGLPDYGEGRSEAWRKLDSAILHGVVLEHIVGLSKDKQADPGWMAFTRGVEQCVGTLQGGGRYRIAFLVNPARAAQVREICLAGEPLPPRAVEFAPRQPVGLVMRERA